MKKPRILCIKHKASSVSKYRIDPLIENLNAKVRKSIMRINDKVTIGELAKRYKKLGDIWVFKYIADRHTLDVLYTMRNEIGSKIVVDVDDNVWQIPLGNISRGLNEDFINRSLMMAESIRCADWVTVSTEPLKQALLPLNENVAILPNYVKPSEWKFKRKPHKKVRIGWVWSLTHIPDNQEVEEALKKIKAKYGDKIEIVIFGASANIFDFDTVNIPAVKYTEYPKTFMEAGIDISIAPLADNEFNRCKSNIKFLESTMAGACFIGSKVYPYEYSVKQGKTGYVCNGENQWVKHLSYLIENPDKRKELVKNAKKEVLAKYTSSKEWESFYKLISE